MPARNRLKLAHLSYFSAPASDRPIYRTIRRHKVRTILEIGIGRCQRAARMIEVAKLVSPSQRIHYAGIDPFDARVSADGPGVSLKLGHRLLRPTGARIHLIPGDPLTALARTANELGKIDLLVISACLNKRDLDGAWFYLPRLLHAATQTFLEEALPGGRMSPRTVELDEINARAGTYSQRRAA